MKKLLLLILLSAAGFASTAQSFLSSSWVEVEKTNTPPQDSLIITIYNRYPFYQNMYNNVDPPSFAPFEIFAYNDTSGWYNYYGFGFARAIRVNRVMDTSVIQNQQSQNVLNPSDSRWLVSETHIYRYVIPVQNVKTKFRILSRHFPGSGYPIVNSLWSQFFPSAYTDYVYYPTQNLNVRTTKIGTDSGHFYFPIYTPENIDTNHYKSNIVISNLNQIRIEKDSIRWFFGETTGRIFPLAYFTNNVNDFNINLSLGDTSLSMSVQNNSFGYPNTENYPNRVGYAYKLIRQITPTDSNVTQIWGALNVIPMGITVGQDDIGKNYEVKFIEVYNTLGQRLYYGEEYRFTPIKNQVYLFIYHYKNGYVKKEKKIFTNF